MDAGLSLVLDHVTYSCAMMLVMSCLTDGSIWDPCWSTPYESFSVITEGVPNGSAVYMMTVTTPLIDHMSTVAPDHLHGWTGVPLSRPQ